MLLSLLSLLTLGPVEIESVIRVDGQWSPWSTVQSYCVDPAARQNLVTCGGGVETKYRSCTNPAPQGGGLQCDPLVLDDGTQIEGMRVSRADTAQLADDRKYFYSLTVILY